MSRARFDRTAMIFAAGRGERMRPLTDTCPKPLLRAGGKPLIEWQIERLAAAGYTTIVINHAWLGAQIEAALGDGSRWNVALRYSPEHDALETAGGIAHALPLIETRGEPAVFLAVSGDVHSDFDYTRLDARAAGLASQPEPGMHLVMVPNPPFHPAGDFALTDDGLLSLDAGLPRHTFGNIGLYDTRMFRALPRGAKEALSPYYRDAIAQRRASGELYDGKWENVGTPAQLAALDQELGGSGNSR
ncbi:MurNAc alpha-1-phosphate uridylyltransferase [Paraburkholderia caballeronis]|uniref:MurNAc alpha-1-phosphate uridylyltransferase n=2 Tax=Paraburkholderia caballeronis TaxID=416943 RepID=A0A1H7PWI7_9BURK|nr:nucleotidyltransferase family protein [Paraburkholderia caballeronis]PXW24380.1 MurNAc alpha-1-phosphate uridylyltransferase [Paraburkholderia caballeronis]PXX00162.1 MurNAc alpha-1-phosphate uridylyltransferase [Paraburkholderia caballeronis]RAJ97291.1 MurNAc alpha-1-phosphate uridylyltransferase [Paraburkholderia caballeronis]SEB65496.1 MurNAc alpha-1-phosphate uridylyltransferase [Paraburkholderia caballeronis]SEL40210.1 MurNAc alpha-1-phosphate uridylyltransferase [Paraburkholderia caba